MNYKSIGEIIELQKCKNNIGLTDNDLLGININKKFVPSVANTIGTDITAYKVVKKGWFACNRMHVGRDRVLPVSLSDKDKPFIVSPAYDVFVVTDENVLPEYLMMWFSRKQFDKEAWFYTDGDVRGGLPWDSFCNMKLPVPSIQEQQKLVNEYNIVQNRIDTLNRINNNLESITMSYIEEYIEKHPVYTNEKISSYGTVITGKTPSMDIKEYYNKKDVPFIKTPDMHQGAYVVSYETYLSKSGADSQKNKYLPANTILMTCIGSAGELSITSEISQTNQQINAILSPHAEILYLILKKYKKDILAPGDGGTTMTNVNKTEFENFVIPKYDEDNMKTIENGIKPIFSSMLVYLKELKVTKEFRDLLLSSIANKV